MKRFIISIVFLISVITVIAQDNYQAVPYTLADRDRLIKVEANVEALEKRIDQMDQSLNNRIDQVEQSLGNRIDRLEDKFDTYFTWGFGLVLGAIFALFGFIIYDRRTTLAPVKREQDKVIEVLKELSKKDSNIREALKKVAL
ncbi:MAG: hypothetical protein H8D45_05670 [Bacteroidetes bacterium]|nr:hypothetical protein [Bacteroidota bacterium]